jgi:hypothetical protein
MNLDLQRFNDALHAALVVREVSSDAGRCHSRIELDVLDAAGPRRILLWRGEPHAPLIALHASTAVWCDVFSPLPSPGHQSLGALRRRSPGFAVVGDELAVMQALPFMERLLENLRAKLNALRTGAAWRASRAAMRRWTRRNKTGSTPNEAAW